MGAGIPDASDTHVMGLHHRPGIGQRTLDRLRTLFLGDQRPDDPPAALELHTGADESMDTTRFLEELADERVREYDTIDQLRALSYGPDRLPNLRGITGQEWEYSIYRREPASSEAWRWICHGLYTTTPPTLRDALSGSQAAWADGVAAAIRADWLNWNTASIHPGARLLYACHVRPAGTEMWTGRHLGGEH